jgi:hypothetical protein
MDVAAERRVTIKQGPTVQLGISTIPSLWDIWLRKA